MRTLSEVTKEQKDLTESYNAKMWDLECEKIEVLKTKNGKSLFNFYPRLEELSIYKKR